MKIVVIGKSGQVASELNNLSNNKREIICLGRNELNIADKNAIEKVLTHLKPDAVINAAAYTAVDLAEKEPEQANQINGYSVGNLAQACHSLSLHLVHLSTDFVFDGNSSTPYLTTDQHAPINTYGASKAIGEKLLLELAPETSCIIRTAWVYSTYGNNFVKTMLNLMESKPELGIISDQIGTPTYAKTLAKAALHAAKNQLMGIYHWTDQGVASWYDFAVAIQELAFDKDLISKNIAIKAITTADYPTPAKRPSFSVLDKSQNSNTFPSELIVHWRQQLNSMLNDLKNREN
ncbi:dTDP-4-dehydrorhamnose reductase [Thalassotalea profundi]|uniref:dTDP-4-dehydrorhamnose reductase n=1 Tax=Thalassotalea profundi TaxID=2036687 RepID=A0ABQ3IRL2_9GAMM|nr:dTDP-4-dehydrorhamnose reductase [Thalassotalea profundi]GHE89496.1 NAD(P)-dependent oxidoreductase [Thalassotalea profundi]